MTSEAEENWTKGYELYFLGKKTESLAYFQRAAQLRGEGKDFESLEDNLADLNRLEEVLPFLKSAVERSPSDTSYYRLGRVYSRLGRYEDALPNLEQAAKIFKKTFKKETWIQEHNYYHGKTLFELNRYEEALPYLKKAVTLADEWNNPKWLSNCQELFKLCLERVGDRATKILESVDFVPKHSWLKRFFYGDWVKLENEYWARALKSDTADEYISYFHKYPDSVHAVFAKNKIRTLRAEESRVINTMSGITLSYQAENKFFIPLPSLKSSECGYILTLSFHLLKDVAPDDRSSQVRGVYGSRVTLYASVKTRTAEIYRAFCLTPWNLNISEVILDCYHGVSQITTDFPTRIYRVSIIQEKMAGLDRSKLSNEDIQKLWLVKEDIIPKLYIN